MLEIFCIFYPVGSYQVMYIIKTLHIIAWTAFKSSRKPKVLRALADNSIDGAMDRSPEVLTSMRRRQFNCSSLLQSTFAVALKIHHDVTISWYYNHFLGTHFHTVK